MAKKEIKEEVQDVAVAEATVETQEQPVKEDPKKEISLKEKDPEAFLKDFNWHNYQEGIDPIDDGKLEEFEKLVADNFVDTLDDEVVDGEVVFITDRDAIIDIKNPYDAFTFDKQRSFELTERTTGDPNLDAAQKEYYHQMQSYMVLFDKPVAYLVFTLNENDYMVGDEYDEFGTLDRIIIKKVLRDPELIVEYKRRLDAYKEAILDAKISRKESMIATGNYLSELKKK